MLSVMRKRKNNTRLLDSISRCNSRSLVDEVVKQPPGMCIIYRDDYDISIVDRAVKMNFRYLKQTLPELETELHTLEESTKSVSSMVEYNTLSRSISQLKHKIRVISEDIDVREYYNKSKVLIDKYKTLAKKVEAVDINAIKDTSQIEYTEQDIQRIVVISDYLTLASKYMDIDWVHEGQEDNTNMFCQACNYNLEETPPNQEGYQVCPNCGVIKYVTSIEKVVNTTQEVYTTKEYCDESNFKKAFIRFVCQQEITYDMEDIVNKLDLFFQSRGHSPAQYYRDQPVVKGWKKEGTSLKLLIFGLKSIGHSEIYEDYNIIGCNLWGWNVPDASYLEEIIMSDYRETQHIYSMMDKKKIERRSCISTQLRLFKHLQLRGFECNISDFKVPVQYETMRKQESLWKEMCDMTSNSSIYYIGSSNT